MPVLMGSFYVSAQMYLVCLWSDFIHVFIKEDFHVFMLCVIHIHIVVSEFAYLGGGVAVLVVYSTTKRIQSPVCHFVSVRFFFFCHK